MTQEDIFFAPTKKDSRHDRLSIKNLLKEKNTPHSLFEIAKKNLKHQLTMKSSKTFKESIRQLDLPKTVLNSFFYNR